MRLPIVMDRADPAALKRHNDIPLMKRKAVITVEYEAEDYLKAVAREDAIRRAMAELKADFDRIDVRFADRRPRHKPRAAAPLRTWPRD